MSDTLAELEKTIALCENTKPGEWAAKKSCAGPRYLYCNEEMIGDIGRVCDLDFIAHANPQRVKALCEALKLAVEGLSDDGITARRICLAAIKRKLGEGG